MDIGSRLSQYYFPYSSVGGLLTTILSTALTFGSLSFLLYFLWSAFRWLSAGGDKSKVEFARQRMTNAFTGLVLLAAAWAVFTIIVYILGLPVAT